MDCSWRESRLPSLVRVMLCLGQTLKSRRSCLEKFALGKSRGKSGFSEGRSPEGKSDYPKNLLWANFQIIPKAFPRLVRLQASKTEENVSRSSGLNIFRVSRGVV